MELVLLWHGRCRQGTLCLTTEHRGQVLIIWETVLSSIVVDHLKKRFDNQNVPILCMYLNYKESCIQTLENLIGSLLKQLVQYQEENFRSTEIKRLFREAQNETRLTLSELEKVLRSEIMAFQR